MKTILFLILFATCINFNACKSANSEDDNVTVFNSEQNKINKNDWVDFSKISVSKDSLDLVLFNLMLKYGNYPEDEFLKNIEILIKKGANPDTSIEYEYSVRKFGTYIPIVKHFYNNKYRHYKKSSTSFLKAVNTDNIKIVKKFIELGANVNKASKAGDYPLNIAISKNSEEIIDLLLKNGADISFADLSKNKNIDLIEKLVRLGANPQTININFAVNDEKLLKRLLNLHPDVNKYPLNYKTVFTNDNLLSLLIKNGLNDKAKGTFPDDCPPVYGAIKYGELKHIKILKNAGFNINKNCGGIKDDVLFLVIKMQKKDILNYYLNEMKTDPNVKNMAKESALIAAVDTDNDEIVKMLLKAGADLEYTGYFSSTPLMYAAQYGKYISAQTLINAGANVNYTDKYGETPLIQAVNKKNFAMIKLLIENGADTKVKYKNMTLSEYAKSKDCPNMIIGYLENNE